MMEIEMLVDVWGLIKSYVPSKDKTVVAGKFIDIALDHGIEDHELRELMGNDEELDDVIKANLDSDFDIDEDL
jgi:hypothetical protein